MEQVLLGFITSESGHTKQELQIPYPSHLQRSSSFTIWFLNNILYVSFAVMSPYSTGYDTDNISFWITVSHHPENVIVISSSSPPDTDLSVHFTQPTAEQVLQLTSHLDHKPAKHTRSIFALHQRCKLCKKALQLH